MIRLKTKELSKEQLLKLREKSEEIKNRALSEYGDPKNKMSKKARSLLERVIRIEGRKIKNLRKKFYEI